MTSGTVVNNNTMAVAKQKVGYCVCCGMKRTAEEVRREENYIGEDGVTVSVQNDSDDYWNVTTVDICQVCLDNLIKLNNIIKTNQLREARLIDVKYSVPRVAVEVEEDER